MANHIKEYKVLGRQYGIEDFKSPGEHFFNGKDTNGKPLPRFMLWGGGCGIGYAKTLQKANDKLYQYIYKDASHKAAEAERQAYLLQRVVDQLNATPNNLAHFKTKGKPK